MNIRRFEERDREAALALAPRLLENVNPWRDQESARAGVIDTVSWSLDHQADDDLAVFVAEDDEGLAGMVKVFEKGHFTGNKDAWVDGLAVQERIARQGLGTELMKVCEDWARKRGHDRVYLETVANNKGAREFYSATGYTENAILLSKEL